MNGSAETHPRRQQLEAFRSGRVMPEEASAITTHLAECTDCCDKLDCLPPDDLDSMLRQLGTQQYSEPADCARPKRVSVGSAQASGTPDDASIPSDMVDHPKYRVLERLGSGGMGAVFKAEHTVMERMVALKFINRSMTRRPEVVERFRREVKTAARLTHPNIVISYDAEQVGDTHFLVMEFVKGTTLAQLVADSGPRSIGEACDFVRQAAVGLQYAHEQGMVHRDVKPHNLMRTPDGRVKILDFGLARFASETVADADGSVPPSVGSHADSITASGVMGTPDFIAPEQARDPHGADIRADIYSLGCTFYYLLTGRAPFHDAGNAAEKVAAHVSDLQRAPSLRSLRPAAPGVVLRVVERMMEKDPGK